MLEKLKLEENYTRLIAFAISLITGTILYFRFWKKFIPEDPASYALGICVAFGSAFLLDRTIVRAGDLYYKKQGERKVSIALAGLYFLLVIVTIGVLVLDRAAEIFVMKNNRAVKLINENEAKIAEAKKTPAVRARETRIAWLSDQIARAAKEDSIKALTSRRLLSGTNGALDQRAGELRRLLTMARKDSNTALIASLSSQLNEVSAQRVNLAASFQEQQSGQADKYRKDLAKEDSLYRSEISVELARLNANKTSFETVGFDNPIGSFLDGAPSMIILLIVIGLFVSARMIEHQKTLTAYHEEFDQQAAVLQTQNPIGFEELANGSDNTHALREMMANLGKRLKAESEMNVDPNRPFIKGSFGDAKDWLTYMVFSEKFRARYGEGIDGDFAAACRHAGIKHKPNEGEKSQRSSLYRHLQSEIKRKAKSSAEDIAFTLQKLERFNEVSPGVTKLAFELTTNNSNGNNGVCTEAVMLN